MYSTAAPANAETTRCCSPSLHLADPPGFPSSLSSLSSSSCLDPTTIAFHSYSRRICASFLARQHDDLDGKRTHVHPAQMTALHHVITRWAWLSRARLDSLFFFRASVVSCQTSNYYCSTSFDTIDPVRSRKVPVISLLHAAQAPLGIHTPSEVGVGSPPGVNNHVIVHG